MLFYNTGTSKPKNRYDELARRFGIQMKKRFNLTF
jgi:hypothetical protein